MLPSREMLPCSVCHYTHSSSRPGCAVLCRAQPRCVMLPCSADIIPPLNAAGFWDTYRAWFLGLMQALPKGRLLKYDPRTGEAHVLAKVSAV
jgi:hypothetical protein